MNAQEMFKELGYMREKEDNIITYKRKSCGTLIRVWDGIEKYYVITHSGKEITPVHFKEHRAIHQQMKELGWL